MLPVILNLTVNLVRMSGHAGITGNEAADALAKWAINDGKLLEIILPLPEFFSIAREKCWHKSNQSLFLQSLHKDSIYFNLFYDASIEKQQSHSVECVRIIIILLLAYIAKTCPSHQPVFAASNLRTLTTFSGPIPASTSHALIFMKILFLLKSFPPIISNPS